MTRFWRRHGHKILAGHSILVLCLVVFGALTITFSANIFALLAAATSSLTSEPVVMYFTPYQTSQMKIGDTATVDLNINSKIPVNAVGATITFPVDAIDVVGFSKAKSFLDLWTEETAIDEQKGEVHFSGGTFRKGGITGTSTVITLAIRAKRAGDPQLDFKETEVYASNPSGTSVSTGLHPLVLHIAAPVAAKVVQGGGGSAPMSISAPGSPTPPKADLNGDGYVNLIDVSIMAIHILGPYDPRYDLDMDGTVGLSDFSIVVSKMGTRI